MVRRVRVGLGDVQLRLASRLKGLTAVDLEAAARITARGSPLSEFPPTVLMTTPGHKWPLEVMSSVRIEVRIPAKAEQIAGGDQGRSPPEILGCLIFRRQRQPVDAGRFLSHLK